jgi:hypothetical protein
MAAFGKLGSMPHGVAITPGTNHFEPGTAHPTTRSKRLGVLFVLSMVAILSLATHIALTSATVRILWTNDHLSHRQNYVNELLDLTKEVETTTAKMEGEMHFNLEQWNSTICSDSNPAIRWGACGHRHVNGPDCPALKWSAFG